MVSLPVFPVQDEEPKVILDSATPVWAKGDPVLQNTEKGWGLGIQIRRN